MTMHLKKATYTLALAFAALVSPPVVARAEPAVARVDNNHYRGSWLEIGRRPMWLTDGCVAGYTTYRPGLRAGQIMVEDGCREGTPTGKLKTVKGKGELVDVETNRAKLRVRYPLPITFNYWVLYESPSHDWFISADPEMKNLWIYARRVPDQNQARYHGTEGKVPGI